MVSLIDVGEAIISTFSSWGPVGMLLALTLIIMIDGIGFPTLPEFWMIWIYSTNPDSFWWGFSVVIVSTSASLVGNFTLYSLVKIARIPRWIKKQMKRYLDFIIINDERLLLLNRVAPIVPYTGAFIAVSNWNLKKCVLYLVTGAMARSSAWVLISWQLMDEFRDEVAPWIAGGAALLVLLISLIASVIYRRRVGLRGKPERSQS